MLEMNNHYGSKFYPFNIANITIKNPMLYEILILKTTVVNCDFYHLYDMYLIILDICIDALELYCVVSLLVS
jgi:hypothetical protein